MDYNFQRSLKLVLKHEGGFVDHPSDPGGATNKGVTIGTYRRYVNRKGTVADLKRITDAQVAAVYKKHYWDKVRGDALPSGIDYAVFDFAVNSGYARAARYLQSVVGTKQDGRVGPKTLAACAAMDAATIINRLCDARMAFLHKLPTWGTFGRGWSRRVSDVRRHAKAMVGGSTDSKHTKPPEPRQPEPESAPSGKASFWSWLFGLIGKILRGGK